MKQKLIADPNRFKDQFRAEGSLLAYRMGQVIFAQGQASDAVFYIDKGKIKLTVMSKQSKEAVLAILSTGDLLGEACLIGQQYA